MKVILVAINARYSHSNLALLYLTQVAEDFSDLIIIKSFTINSTAETIVNELIMENADAYGFSVYIWNAQIIDAILPRLKRACPQARIFLGGPEVSYTTKRWTQKHPDVDYIICGPGEAGFRLLLHTGFRHDKKIITEQNPAFSEIDFPYKNIDFGIFENRYIYYESSRGCPFRCTFCLSSLQEQKLEFRRPAAVKAELAAILKESPTLIKFIDRTFNAHRPHYHPIWKFLLKEFPDTSTGFHFEIDPALLDDSDFKILEQCPPGLFQFEIGIQSINSESLKSVRRNISWHRTQPNIERLVQLKNIHIHVDLLVGLPHDNMEHTIHSFNEVYSLGANYLQLGFLKVLPGTRIREQATEYGISFRENPPYEIIENQWLSREDVSELKQIAGILENMHNPGNLKTVLIELVSHYESAFGFFRKFSEFITAQDLSGKMNHREEKIKALASFIDALIPHRKQFLTDCLRWDWCSNVMDHRYPKILSTKQTQDTRRKGIRYLEEQKKMGDIKNGSRSLTKAAFKQSIFFKPETEEFLKKYCEGAALTVFLPDKTMLRF